MHHRYTYVHFHGYEVSVFLIGKRESQSSPLAAILSRGYLLHMLTFPGPPPGVNFDPSVVRLSPTCAGVGSLAPEG
jgi:hypothetical protein